MLKYVYANNDGALVSYSKVLFNENYYHVMLYIDKNLYTCGIDILRYDDSEKMYCRTGKCKFTYDESRLMHIDLSDVMSRKNNPMQNNEICIEILNSLGHCVVEDFITMSILLFMV